MTVERTGAATPHRDLPGVLGPIWRFVGARGLRPGDRLPSIRELAERFDVKQTAVRDALLKAESLGLVSVLPRAGVFVRGPSLDAALPTPAGERPEQSLGDRLQTALFPAEFHVVQLLDARRLVEIELAGRAAERRRIEDLLPVRQALESLLQLPIAAPVEELVDCDLRFHSEIARLSGHSVLCAVQQTLLDLLRPHLVAAASRGEHRELADRSHRAIYKQLVAGDAEALQHTLHEHLGLAYESLLRYLQRPPRRAVDGVATERGGGARSKSANKSRRRKSTGWRRKRTSAGKA